MAVLFVFPQDTQQGFCILICCERPGCQLFETAGPKVPKGLMPWTPHWTQLLEGAMAIDRRRAHADVGEACGGGSLLGQHWMGTHEFRPAAALITQVHQHIARESICPFLGIVVGSTSFRTWCGLGFGWAVRSGCFFRSLWIYFGLAVSRFLLCAASRLGCSQSVLQASCLIARKFVACRDLQAKAHGCGENGAKAAGRIAPQAACRKAPKVRIPALHAAIPILYLESSMFGSWTSWETVASVYFRQLRMLRFKMVRASAKSCDL